MNPEFIPSQFSESGGECKICDARMEFEQSLTTESNLLLSLGTGGEPSLNRLATLSPTLLQAYLQLWSSLGDALSDYRVCFAQNLALYFTAERFGRLRKVPELVGACDEYRQRALASLAEFDQAFDKFKALSGSEQPKDLELPIALLLAVHDATMRTARAFWEQIDIWTQARNKTARSLFGKSE